MKKVGEVKWCSENGQAQALEVEVGGNEVELEMEDAFENVSIETHVPKFVLDQMLYTILKVFVLYTF